MRSKYMNPRNVRREVRTLAGRFRGGKLQPVCATYFGQSESGMLNQNISMELDPIAGRMITAITGELIAVAVPAPAIDEVKNPTEALAGTADMYREKLLSGAPVFDLEDQNAISKACGVVPRSIGGVKKVNEAVRLAHIAAVNHLRRRKYVKAVTESKNASSVTEALIGQTVLDRLNGVLDPEDRVNGKVNFSGRVSVKGLGKRDGVFTETNLAVTDADGAATYAKSEVIGVSSPNERFFYVEENPEKPGHMNLHADMSGIEGVSIEDFYRAQRTDQLTREMRKVVDDNPQKGEAMVANFAHGLAMDTGQEPFVLYEKSQQFGASLLNAMDGPNLDTQQTNMMLDMGFSVPVPATEFGMVVITFAVVKPDETLSSQPHPFLSKEWGARNYVVDELALDPDPVTIRELDGDCDAADEDTIALYTGRNQLERNYLNYGFTRDTDLTTVESKTALWQLEVPMSVTPQSVLYPENLDHYPFADGAGDVCTYTINSVQRCNTPIIFGPTPVEELAEIEDADIFEDATA